MFPGDNLRSITTYLNLELLTYRTGSESMSACFIIEAILRTTQLCDVGLTVQYSGLLVLKFTKSIP